jgi:hypothetical protein
MVSPLKSFSCEARNTFARWFWVQLWQQQFNTWLMDYACRIQSFLQAGMIVAGWDKYDGGSVYGIPLGGTLLRLPFSSGGL